MGKGFWRHERFMDLKALVLKVQYRGPRYMKVKVEWWVRDYSLGFKQTIKIMNQDLKHWEQSE